LLITQLLNDNEYESLRRVLSYLTDLTCELIGSVILFIPSDFEYGCWYNDECTVIHTVTMSISIVLTIYCWYLISVTASTIPSDIVTNLLASIAFV